MVMSAHGRALRQLLPPGRLFSDSPDSNLQRLLDGLGLELDRVSDSAAGLPLELDPSHGLLGLPEWERVLGLPDECGPVPVTIPERRRAVLGRLLAGGSLSRAFYIELARSQGYDVEIVEGEAAPFRCGESRCGDPLGVEEGVFAWTMVVKTDKRPGFRTGQSRCGDALGSLGDELLECIIRRAAPAHTEVSFRYIYTGWQPGQPGGGAGAIEGECWWTIRTGSSNTVRVATQEGTLIVYDEVGARIDLGVEDGSFSILDEDGNPLQVAIDCEESTECAVPVWLGDGAQSRMVLVDGAWTVLDADGGALRLPPVGDSIPVDIGGNDAVGLPIVCGGNTERWWHVLDSDGSSYLNLQTEAGDIYVDLGPARIGLGAAGGAFTLDDEDGATMRIPLSETTA